jgi:hypothetical protein
MTRLFKIEPFTHAAGRAGRLQLFAAGVLGFVVVSIWDPVAHPGPKCCLLRWLFGLPCPLCGMTRAMSLCVRGRFLEASGFHPLAVPAFVLAIGLCVKWAAEYATARRIDLVLPRPCRRAVWAVVTVAVAAAWAYLLAFRREDDFAETWVGMLLRLIWP